MSSNASGPPPPDEGGGDEVPEEGGDEGSVRSRGTSKRGSSASGDDGSRRPSIADTRDGIEMADQLPISKKLGAPHSDVDQFPPETIERLATDFERRYERPFPAGTLMFLILFTYLWMVAEGVGGGGE